MHEAWHLRKGRRVSLKAAVRFGAELDERMPATDRNPSEQEVQEVLERTQQEENVGDAPAEAAVPSLSLQERLADALVELRRNLNVKGTLVALATRYGIRRQTLTVYKKLFINELQRDPPVSDDILRRMVLREAQTRDKRQRGHSRYFTELDEQMLVGILLGHDLPSVLLRLWVRVHDSHLRGLNSRVDLVVHLLLSPRALRRSGESPLQWLPHLRCATARHRERQRRRHSAGAIYTHSQSI